MMKRILNPQSAGLTSFPTKVLAALGLAALVVSGNMASAASPDLQNTLPRGGQRGSEVQVTFLGNRLEDAEEVVFHYPGITAKDLVYNADGKSKKVTATFVIAPDAHLGEHHVRVRCKSGMSYARTFWVSQFPNVDEVEPNDDFENPQKIEKNVTIEAEAKPEETDYYQISAKKGERISVEIEGLRINNITNNIAIDPFVSILNKDQFEIASADGSALLKQESILSIEAPEDGEYIVEVRDSAYQGRGRYRAHIGTFPRPTVVYPAGAKGGTETEFSLIGDVKGTYKQKVKVPAQVENDLFGVYGANGGLLPPSPNEVRVSPFDNALEVEPNNTYKEASPTPGLPIAMNGILQTEGDEDYFKFTAKKNESFTIQVYANAIGTPVDPVLYVYDAKMKGLGSSDDADGTKDGKFAFKAPEDGEYYVRVRDMLLRGGPDYVYRIETLKASPTIEVTMPEMLRRNFQYRKQFNVPQGGYYAMTVTTKRVGVSGELKFDFPKLPQGVSLVGGVIPKSVTQGPILLKAEPNAPIGGEMVDLVVKTTDPENPVSGQFVQAYDFVRGPQNGVEYYTRYNSELPVSVVEALPFSVTIEQPKVPIVRNGTMKLKVRAHRKDGYDKNIIVRFLWKPAGITCPSSMTFKGTETELEYELNANGSAELATWDIGVLAESDGGKGLMMTASPYAKLTVEEPFVDMKLSLATAKQTENIDLLADFEAVREFDGQADVQIFGLPAHATTDVLKATKATESLAFPIAVSEKTPVGQHKNLFCTVTVMKNGEPIVHRVGTGGTFRVDPKPKEAPKKPAEKKVVATNEAKPKPLSRLEQLRLEAQKASAE